MEEILIKALSEPGGLVEEASACMCVCLFVHAAGAERYIRNCVRGIVMKH